MKNFKIAIFFYRILTTMAICWLSHSYVIYAMQKKGDQFTFSNKEGGRIYGTFISDNSGFIHYRNYLGVLKKIEKSKVQNSVITEDDFISFSTKSGNKFEGNFIAEDDENLYYHDKELGDIVKVKKNEINLTSIIKKTGPNCGSETGCNSGTVSLSNASSGLKSINENIMLEKKKTDLDYQNDYLKNCISQNSGKEKLVSNDYAEECIYYEKNGNQKIEKKITYGGKKRYKLESDGNSLVLTSKVQFNFKGENNNWSKMTYNMRKNKRCIDEFYKKNGIKTKLTFYYDYGQHKTDADHVINVWDNIERANADNWASLFQQGEEIPDGQRCRLAIHEFNHLLGLKDEYSDDKCTNRNVYNDGSIMGSEIYNNPSVTLKERHLKEILSPFCE